MFMLSKLILNRLTGLGLVAVSGGADSVAMFRLLLAAKQRFHVGHFNHRLRGEASDQDETSVRELCGHHGIVFHVGSADTATIAASKRENLEDTARSLRYSWLIDTAQAIGAEWVAVGHHADDQVETILYRLLRGTGLQGLCGIPSERELAPGLWLVRPMLDFTRSEIQEYLQSIQQHYQSDASNDDLGFTRNRIRHELLPLLETFNPEARRAILQLATQANELYHEQHILAEQLLRDIELPQAGNMVILDAERLKRANPVAIRAMFRLLWEREKFPLREMTFAHWNRLTEMATEELVACDFPGGVHVRRRGRVLQVVCE